MVAQFCLDSSPLLQRDSRLRKEVIRTLLQFADVISIGGCSKTNLISHLITVHPGTTPIKMKHRPLNPVMEESLRQQIDRWLEQRVVEEADSPWSFPLVQVLKKNSQEVRWAVNYRRLNAVTKKDAFPLPNIADNLYPLEGSRVFSALDGARAFHAVPVRRADQEKTAFSSPFGQYQFVRMPFGLANAPATYSQLVAKALRHLWAPHAALPLLEEEKVLVSDEAAVVVALQAPHGFAVEKIKDHQEREEHLHDIQRWKTEPPSETEKPLLSPDQRRLLAFLPSLHQDPSSGLWSLRNPEDEVSGDCLHVPHALPHQFIEADHQFLGHAGITATAHFCQKRVFMFRLVLEVHRVLQHCHACQVKSQKTPVQKDVHFPSVQAGAPFLVWSMDVLGPLRASSEGHRYLLMLKDVFSKWFEAIPLSNMTSEKVLRALQMIYARFGYPLQVHTDNAMYFRSQAMQEAFQRAGV